MEIDNKLYLTWYDVQLLVDALCESITKSELKITSITGLRRGGLIPAVMVSHELNLPWSDVIRPDTLVIDDICDTGETLNSLPEGTLTAVLHHKPHTSSFTPDLYASLHENDKFIFYPWEREDAEPIADYLRP